MCDNHCTIISDTWPNHRQCLDANIIMAKKWCYCTLIWLFRWTYLQHIFEEKKVKSMEWDLRKMEEDRLKRRTLQRRGDSRRLRVVTLKITKYTCTNRNPLETLASSGQTPLPFFLSLDLFNFSSPPSFFLLPVFHFLTSGQIAKISTAVLHLKNFLSLR